ncbi:MAG: hypothetical protein IVW57_17190 [Ktedonobacterales bacterium]|nr:hypothetical protein [Ktedonobacterales bacterium]
MPDQTNEDAPGEDARDLSEDPAVSEYVRRRAGHYYLGASRVSLASVLWLWQRHGEPPEAIQQSFPSVSLAAIYGAIAYYLDHQPMLDAYLGRLDALGRQMSEEFQTAHPNLYERLMERRAELEAAERTAPTPHDTDAPPDVARTPTSPT